MIALDKHGCSALHHACATDDCPDMSAIITALLAAKANINERYTGYKKNPLMFVGNGNLSAFNLLIDAGANVNCRDCNNETPLMMACKKSDNMQIINALLVATTTIRLIISWLVQCSYYTAGIMK